MRGGGLAQNSTSPKPLDSPGFKKKRKKVPEPSPLMPQRQLHICLPSTGPATKVRGRDAGQSHTCGAMMLPEGLSEGALAEGMRLASWTRRERTRALRGGGWKRDEVRRVAHSQRVHTWKDSGSRGKVHGTISPGKEACPASGPRVTLLFPGLHVLCDPGLNPREGTGPTQDNCGSIDETVRPDYGRHHVKSPEFHPAPN